MMLCTMLWSVKTCALYLRAFCMWNFSFLRQILGVAPFMQKCLIVLKLRYAFVFFAICHFCYLLLEDGSHFGQVDEGTCSSMYRGCIFYSFVQQHFAPNIPAHSALFSYPSENLYNSQKKWLGDLTVFECFLVSLRSLTEKWAYSVTRLGVQTLFSWTFDSLTHTPTSPNLPNNLPPICLSCLSACLFLFLSLFISQLQKLCVLFTWNWGAL